MTEALVVIGSMALATQAIASFLFARTLLHLEIGLGRIQTQLLDLTNRIDRKTERRDRADGPSS